MYKDIYPKSKRSECKSCGRIIIDTPFRCPNCGACLKIRWLIGAVILTVFLSLIFFQVVGNKLYKINKAMIIERMPSLSADIKLGEDKIKSSFEKVHPSFKKVELIEVPNSDDTVKIILQYDKTDSKYAKDFSVAKFDINNDGKDDILYTNRGMMGPCGYSWSIIINKGEGKYEINKCSIVCVGKLLYFSNEYFKGLRIPYDMEEEQAYYCEQ
jgi:RNA polymerase subunit RPABC4/transcription elongation factor Spt4